MSKLDSHIPPKVQALVKTAVPLTKNRHYKRPKFQSNVTLKLILETTLLAHVCICELLRLEHFSNIHVNHFRNVDVF